MTLTISLAALIYGLSQSDYVHQNLEIAWLTISGQNWKLRGKTTAFQVRSDALGETRLITVYTPPGYDDSVNASRRYPVLYLLHGSPDDGDGWIRYGRAPEDVDKLIATENYPPLIVVCPDSHGDGRLGDSEYINSPVPQANGKPGKRIADWVTRDVVGWTDAHFRTEANAAGRLLGGLSEGGYGAVNLGLQHPEEFSILMAFSGYYKANPYGWARPVWGKNPDPARLARESPASFVGKPDPRWANTFVYLGDGLSDRAIYRDETAQFAQTLQNAKIDFVHRSAPGRHSWDLWRGQIDDALHLVRNRLQTSPPGKVGGVTSASARSGRAAVALLAVAVAALGLLNLWSALLARGPGRGEFLRNVVHLPLLISHASRTLTALFGLALLALARSLARRKRQAWRIAVCLVALSGVLHLIKGLDWEETAICAALLAALMRFKTAFWAGNDRPSARQGLLAASGLLLFAAVYGPVGFYLLRREYVPRVTPVRAVREASHLLIYVPENSALSPRTRRANWFEDSLLIVSIAALGYALLMLLRPVLARGTGDDADRRRARALLQTFGGPPLARFALLPDKRFLFGDDWAIAYVVVGHHAVALGDPLGDPARLLDAVASFLALCRRHDWAIAFYQTTARVVEGCRQTNLKALKVGEDAQIELQSFTLTGKKYQDLRTASNKMAKNGVALEEVRDADADTLTQLAAISEQWLRARGGEEKTFAMGGFDPQSALFDDSRTFAARQADGQILGFITCVPVFGGNFGAQNGWGLDLMRRRDDAPAGLMEALIVSAAQNFQREGASIFSLGLSPLAEGDTDPHEDEMLARGRALLFERFNHFYSFKGLHAFKEKFGPCWEPRYLIYAGNPRLAATIYAVLKAHSPRGLRLFARRAPR